jgi:hypothetical protein
MREIIKKSLKRVLVKLNVRSSISPNPFGFLKRVSKFLNPPRIEFDYYDLFILTLFLDNKC